MATENLLDILEEGIKAGRITPYLASYIAASELKAWPDELEFDIEPLMVRDSVVQNPN